MLGFAIRCAILFVTFTTPAVWAQEGQAPVAFDLRVADVGVGGLARGGSWVGLDLRFRDPAESPREVLFEVRVGDADGDTALYHRAVATNPGQEQRAWVYAYLPHNALFERRAVVSAYEAQEAPDSPVGYAPGATLARVEAPTDAVQPDGVGTMLVVGRTPGGLLAFADRGASSSTPWATRGHQAFAIAGELEPADLPDRGVGLLGTGVIVWTDARPTELSDLRAQAVTEWVERGGHLVVSPGARFDEWAASDDGIAALVPDIARVPSSPALVSRLITRESVEPPPGGFECSAFENPAGAGYRVVLADATGMPVVIRREVGLGAVTLVGIDLASGRLADRDLPHAEAFWARVLGWRLAMPADADAEGGRAILGGRRAAYVDADIAGLVGMSGAAAAGVLVGLIMFAAYFVVAGPLAFVVLKRMNATRWAWSLYGATALTFTAIAWGVATAIRPKVPEARYVAFLQSVSGTDLVSMRAWASVLMPAYGTGDLRVTEADVSAAVAPWRPPGIRDVLSGQGFPDARPYEMDGRGSGTIRVPTRSTVKQFRIDWAGLSRRWGAFEVVGRGGLGGGEITIDPAGILGGIVRHGLPAALEDAVVIVNRGQRPLAPGADDRLIADAFAVTLARPFDSWEPGVELDLSAIPLTRETSAQAYFEDRSGNTRLFAALLGDDEEFAGDLNDATDRLTAANWVSQFAPPDGEDADLAALRYDTFGLDLARWFTEPCVIIVGHVEVDAQGGFPVPLGLRLNAGADDDWVEPASSGRVVVRWVYPLASRPPVWVSQ